jgi:hypothetical protein
MLPHKHVVISAAVGAIGWGLLAALSGLEPLSGRQLIHHARSCNTGENGRHRFSKARAATRLSALQHALGAGLGGNDRR